MIVTGWKRKPTGMGKSAIQAGNDTAKIQDYLKKIRISGNHLLGIVNEVLEISRIESGQTKLEETVCSIKAFMEIPLLNVFLKC